MSAVKLPPTQTLESLSATQINELNELERTLTLYQMNLLMNAFMHLQGQLPLWGDPKRDQWIKEKQILMYFTPLIWDDETVQELAQLKQLEKLSLISLSSSKTNRQYWQLTDWGYLMVQFYQERIAVYPTQPAN